MATVYLAEDLKHDRKVALKVLRPELAAVIGAERFVVEIKTTAALQHPHILPLFDSGSADGFLYYVMPFVDGETLRSKLDRETQLGVEEAVKIAVAVADALDYAHRQGVVHRDIKPENILLHDGRPMVADFGIALALSAAAGGRMTETGLSLGTPHYMSPEQATAEKEITARSDVYSLGSVLYEMLTGNPPHTGASAQQIIMKIVTEEAQPVTTVRKSVPPNVAAAVARSIHKLPADRFDSAKAFAEALMNPNYSPAATGLAAAEGQRAPLATTARWKLAGLAAGLVAVGAVLGLVLGPPKPAEPEVVRFTMATGRGSRLATERAEDVPFALSPDGRRIVYVGQDSTSRGTRLYLRPIDQLAPVPIQGTEDAVAPFFSPDGLWIGFATRADQKLKKVPVDGGPPITLAADVLDRFASASWGDDGFIVFSSRGFGISRVSGSGGQAVLVSDTTDENAGLLWPQVLPGGKGVLTELCRNRCFQTDLSLLDIETGQVTRLVEGATRGWYLPTGHLLYATAEGALYAAPFDPGKRAITGAAVPLLDNVRSGFANGTRFAVSRAGSMAYLAGGGSASDQVVAQVDRSGREQVVISRPGNYALPRLSPDGERIALNIQAQIWVYDIPSGTLSQLTFKGDNVRPSWSPDGSRLVFSSNRSGSWDLWWAPADGSDPGERVAEGPDVTGGTLTFWSRDGKWIVFDGVAEDDSAAATSEDIFAVPTTGKRIRQLAVGTPADEQSGVVSPDGRWIAYNSDESGTYQVYVRPFLAPGGRAMVSTTGGTEPLWVSNQEIAYRDGDSLTVATLELGARTRVLRRTALFDYSRYRTGNASFQGYDVSRDGKRFLVVRPLEVQADPEPVVVLNWFAEVRRRFAEQGARR
jgi:Tol biopolymer transport system component